jgi:PAS domain-containing protein
VLANDAALKLWNKTSQIVGKPLLEGIPELAGQVSFEKIDLVYKTGIPYRGSEVEVKSMQDGNEVISYFDVYYQPYYEEDSATVSGVFTLSNDVTEKVLTKRKTEESEAKFRTLFKTMDQGFSIVKMIFDEEGRPVDSLFLEMNSVFEQQSGFEGALGKKIREIVPDIEDKWFQVYGKVALTGEAIRFTDGSDALGKWFDIYAFPAGEVGSQQVAVLFTDITERVLSQKKIEASQRNLLNLFEEARVGIATLSADDSLIYETANLFYSELVGRKPAELIGKPMMEALPELKGQGFDDLLKDVIARGRGLHR